MLRKTKVVQISHIVEFDYPPTRGILTSNGNVFGGRLFVKHCILALSIVVALIGNAPSYADAPVPADSSDVAEFVNGVLNESINANTLFASQEAIATGRYVQRQNSQPDKDYTTIRLPGRYAFGDLKDPVRPLIIGNGALLRTTAGYNPPDGIGESDFTVTSLFALSASGGALVKLSESVTFSPTVSLTYSHIKNRYDFNNPYSQGYLEQYESELFNWKMDVFTYTPALKLYYQEDIGLGVFNYQIAYSYLFNDTISDDSALIDVNSSTGLTSNRFDVLIPTGVEADAASLFVRPMFQWNNISGNAVAGLGLRDLYEVGADLVAKVLESESWVSTVTVGASYVTGDSFEGYHIGAGATF